MNTEHHQNKPPRFCWYKDDLESKFGLRGAPLTHVLDMLWFIVAGIVTAAFYGIISPFANEPAGRIFTQRGVFQYIIVFVSFWAIFIVLVKWSKIKVQRKALTFGDLVPTEADFVLSPATVGGVLSKLRSHCDDPKRYFLFRRIEQAMSNLKNMGQVRDLDDVLQSLADNDEQVMESSYTLVKGLIWAIPVLGFIGTVQGLGKAIGNFGAILAGASDISQIKDVLQGVTGGLATAFDTTFLALIAALGIQLLLVMVRKSEECLMVECKNFCQQHLVGRLRLTDFERAG